MRDAPNSVALRVDASLQLWADSPWKFDFFAVMRRLEASAPSSPRWGRALLPSAEPIRVGQEASLAFAPASFSRFEDATAHSPPRLRQQFFGYIGPNGPLPVHLSEYIQERMQNYGDPTWLAFLDAFTHRFALHFYRAWTQSRPAVSLDRPAEDNFRRQVGSFVGAGTAARGERDAIHDDARLHFSGWLARQVRSPDGVEAVLKAYFGVPTRLEKWVGHWMQVSPGDVTYLGRGGMTGLGCGALLGTKVWDRQHRVRLYLGPLSMAQYRQFLPSGAAWPVFQLWMRQLLGDELYWDVVLVLRKDEVPAMRLGAESRVGWTSWVGKQVRTRDAADVRMDSGARVVSA